MATVSIAVSDITAIEDLGCDGTLVRLVEEPHEHLRSSFYDVLSAYCEAVDSKQGAMEIDD